MQSLVQLKSTSKSKVCPVGRCQRRLRWFLLPLLLAGAPLPALEFIPGISSKNAELAGAFTNATLKTGSVSSNSSGSGTGTLSSSVPVPFDVPSATGPLTNVSVALGTNVTFTLVATGSEPMRYQWYFNDTAIAQATTASLTLSNLTWAAAGNYSVTVSNVAGGSNALAVLTVVPETVKPTVAITAPANCQRWSNSVFNVTGTAGDNVAVSNVWFQVNANGWQPAASANHWTNWTATANLVSGTNTLQAVAVDTCGNYSTTASVSLIYVVNNVLQVQTAGQGKLSTNYNNVALEIGKNYRLTATGTNGFVFTHWTIATNWLGGCVTNNATVQFTMAANLTLLATFADTNLPGLSITNLTAGQRWSNQVFTARGTATDNGQVARVQYQLNDGNWTPADGTTHWSAPLTLMPGTNTLAAFATDAAGNNSTTNRVRFQYVVKNILGVQAAGRGTLSPNYSNAWLEIGRNYSITSAAASGFIATNWVVSTNWQGGAAHNGRTVQFMMQSNLTLRVIFADVTPPANTITSPTSGQKMTNALATFVGTAKDNWQVAGVWYQVNGSAWSLAATTNRYTNWTQTVTLRAGLNTLKAYAVDLGGNCSATNSLSVVSSNTFALQLAFTNPPTTTDGLSFSLQLSQGLNGHIQVSTNLTSWTTLTNFTGTNSTVTFHDPDGTHSDRRFYRAVVP